MIKLSLILAIVLVLVGCNVNASSGSRSILSEDDSEMQISNFRTVDGTRFLIASLRAERIRRSYSSDSYYEGAAINHLFYDLDSQTAHWLFPSPAQLILETRPLHRTLDVDGTDASVASRKDGKVRAFLYRVVSQDTNDTDGLDSDDRFALAASDPGGFGYSVLVESADRLLGAFWTDETHILLMYEFDGAVQGVEFNVETRKVSRLVKLPDPPEPAPAA